MLQKKNKTRERNRKCDKLTVYLTLGVCVIIMVCLFIFLADFIVSVMLALSMGG